MTIQYLFLQGLWHNSVPLPTRTVTQFSTSSYRDCDTTIQYLFLPGLWHNNSVPLPTGTVTQQFNTSSYQDCDTTIQYLFLQELWHDNSLPLPTGTVTQQYNSVPLPTGTVTQQFSISSYRDNPGLVPTYILQLVSLFRLTRITQRLWQNNTIQHLLLYNTIQWNPSSTFKVANQHTRELISIPKSSHKYNNEDLSLLQ